MESCIENVMQLLCNEDSIGLPLLITACKSELINKDFTLVLSLVFSELNDCVDNLFPDVKKCRICNPTYTNLEIYDVLNYDLATIYCNNIPYITILVDGKTHCFSPKQYSKLLSPIYNRVTCQHYMNMSQIRHTFYCTFAQKEYLNKYATKEERIELPFLLDMNDYNRDVLYELATQNKLGILSTICVLVKYFDAINNPATLKDIQPIVDSVVNNYNIRFDWNHRFKVSIINKQVIVEEIWFDHKTKDSIINWLMLKLLTFKEPDYTTGHPTEMGELIQFYETEW